MYFLYSSSAGSTRARRVVLSSLVQAVGSLLSIALLLLLTDSLLLVFVDTAALFAAVGGLLGGKLPNKLLLAAAAVVNLSGIGGFLLYSLVSVFLAPEGNVLVVLLHSVVYLADVVAGCFQFGLFFYLAFPERSRLAASELAESPH